MDCNWSSLKEAVLENAKTEIVYTKDITSKYSWSLKERTKKMDERRA